jgi:xanthine dehydrogenase accessory factor
MSNSIFTEVVALQQAGRSGVLATPFWSRGSTPFSRSAKLLLRDDGSTVGTVGGGALEAAVMRAAREALTSGEVRLMEFDLSAGDAASLGMICGGRCAIFLEPIQPGRGREVFAAAELAEMMGEPMAVITVVLEEASTKMAVSADGTVVGTTGEADVDRALIAEAQAALSEGAPRYLEQPIRAHIEPVLQRPSVFVFGAGHVAIPLAQVAAIAGFRVTVIDDREEFANRDRYPVVDEVMVASVDDAFWALAIGRESYVVAVTRGHVMDEEVVAAALGARARYIGMIGSRRKVAGVRERLRERGFAREELDQIHAPIGIEIGSDTVEEIAISIVAELIAERRQEG